MHKTVLALVAAAGLLAAALILNATPKAVAVPKCNVSNGYSNPWGGAGYPTKVCPDGLVECGLIVW
ncbi:MAG: hypothetical protein AB7V13_26690 [Pseudorhodoplanes sp.]|uniref:hypothetical protein n=1 Tax=Pseudorhodoplanes sp. TaxID=1934341 RepID=UPI003D0D64F0